MWLWDFIRFFCFYIKEVVVANMFIAYDILTPPSFADPAFIEVELGEPLTQRQVFVLTNLISMTPGTLSFDLSQDRTRLLLHLMYLRGGEQKQCQQILQQYVKPVKRLF